MIQYRRKHYHRIQYLSFQIMLYHMIKYNMIQHCLISYYSISDSNDTILYDKYHIIWNNFFYTISYCIIWYYIIQYCNISYNTVSNQPIQYYRNYDISYNKQTRLSSKFEWGRTTVYFSILDNGAELVQCFKSKVTWSIKVSQDNFFSNSQTCI